jgi:hypothetical protein
MAASGDQASNNRLTFLPKLLLWALVLLFGYLYLGAVERSEQIMSPPVADTGEPAAEPVADAAAGTGAVEAPAKPAEPVAKAEPAVDKASAVATSPAAPATAAAPQPARAPAFQPSAPPAPQVAAPPAVPPAVTERAEPQKPAAPAPVAAVSQPSAPEPTEPMQPEAPAAAETPVDVAKTADGAEKVTKAEAEAFAQALMSEESSGAGAPAEAGQAPAAPAPGAPAPQPPSVMPAPARSAPMMPRPAAPPQPAAAAQTAPQPATAPRAPMRPQPPAMPAAPTPPQRGQSVAERRAELIEQYEAMRKQAMEEAQKRWEQYYGTRPPMPMGGPRMPMYPPGYAPGRMPTAPAAEGAQ